MENTTSNISVQEVRLRRTVQVTIGEEVAKNNNLEFIVKDLFEVFRIVAGQLYCLQDVWKKAYDITFTTECLCYNLR